MGQPPVVSCQPPCATFSKEKVLRIPDLRYTLSGVRWCQEKRPSLTIKSHHQWPCLQILSFWLPFRSISKIVSVTSYSCGACAELNALEQYCWGALRRQVTDPLLRKSRSTSQTTTIGRIVTLRPTRLSQIMSYLRKGLTLMPTVCDNAPGQHSVKFIPRTDTEKPQSKIEPSDNKVAVQSGLVTSTATKNVHIKDTAYRTYVAQRKAH